MSSEDSKYIVADLPADRKTLVDLLHQKDTTRWQHSLFPVPHTLEDRNMTSSYSVLVCEV